MADSAARERVARAALLEITAEDDVGELLGATEGEDGVVTLEFAALMSGYRGWHWTVSVAELPDSEPSVLEAELLPGDGALVAPDWVPWAQRLEEYRAAQAAAGVTAEEGAEGVLDQSDLDEDGDLDDDFDDLDDGDVDPDDLDPDDLDPDDLDPDDLDQSAADPDEPGPSEPDPDEPDPDDAEPDDAEPSDRGGDGPVVGSGAEPEGRPRTQRRARRTST